MELKDFVKNTILDIVEGVKEAQEENKSGALINFPWYKTDKKETWTEVAFDVDLVTVESEKAGRGIHVNAAGILGGKLGYDDQSSTRKNTHVHFIVSIQPPLSPPPKK